MRFRFFCVLFFVFSYHSFIFVRPSTSPVQIIIFPCMIPGMICTIPTVHNIVQVNPFYSCASFFFYFLFFFFFLIWIISLCLIDRGHRGGRGWRVGGRRRGARGEADAHGRRPRRASRLGRGLSQGARGGYQGQGETGPFYDTILLYFISYIILLVTVFFCLRSFFVVLYGTVQ